MRQVMWLTAKGGPFRLEKPNEDFTLEDMQLLVGGYIEVWPDRVNYHGALVQMTVNEEGALRHLPVNTKASAYVGRPVYGDAFLALDGDISRPEEDESVDPFEPSAELAEHYRPDARD
jgi:hypothetical protein